MCTSGLWRQGGLEIVNIIVSLLDSDLDQEQCFLSEMCLGLCFSDLVFTLDV